MDPKKQPAAIRNSLPVASIIAGDGVCICDECVFVCVKILFKKDRRARNGEKNIKA
ncbi:hypothetical protein VQZ80_002322 [Salmonella enterica]|nr:hypothetical protein [Salmonella enterica]EMD3573669.1 hypothetical protein [Salmonella enterica]EMD7132626.1 hypothetical protein [Salmonella enterica]